MHPSRGAISTRTMLPAAVVFLIVVGTSERLAAAEVRTWSVWSEWSACSATCGPGVETRNRTCDVLDSAGTDPGCPGQGSVTRDCGNNTTCTAVNGSWSEWGEWQNCSVPCGVGNTTRHRTCTNPATQYGGAACDDDDNDVEWDTCDTNVTCEAVDGHWSAWGEWQNCSTACSVGHVTRQRTCTNPAPQYGGAPCNGTSEHWHPCDTNVTCLAVPGGWADWSQWSACSVTCGSGGQTGRMRSCTNPAPAHGGPHCVGDKVETTSCSLPACQAAWSEWTSWTACWAAECRAGVHGKKFRSRQCRGGGTDVQCPGQFMERTDCTPECP